MTTNILKMKMDNVIVKEFSKGRDTYRFFNNCNDETCDMVQVQDNKLLYMHNILKHHKGEMPYDTSSGEVKIIGSYYDNYFITDKDSGRLISPYEALDEIAIALGFTVVCDKLSWEPSATNNDGKTYSYVDIACIT